MIGWSCSSCGRFNHAQRHRCPCGRGDLPRRRAAALAGAPEQVPDAAPVGVPTWPIPGYRKFSRRSFGGPRPWNDPSPTRYHAGVDIHAPRGTIVVATEAGRVLAEHGWRSKKGRPERTTRALLLQVDGGPVIVYGALIPDSWLEFGVDVGTRVARGQPLGRVGVYPNGDEMLHIEARVAGTRVAGPWYRDQPPPASLLDVTPYLEAALATAPGPTPPQPPAPVTPPPVAPPLSRERWIQSSLQQLLRIDLDVDGVIGPKTRAAVRTFQRRAGLDADGIPGPQTIAALEAATGARAPQWTEAQALALFKSARAAWEQAWTEVMGR